MNVHELLRLLQAEHDESAARADHLRVQIERLTTDLAETEARMAELAATRKVIDGLTPPDHEPAPAETPTVYQRIVTTFNEHPGQVFRVRDLHEHLAACPPTSHRSTPPAPAWDDSSARDSSPNPDAAAIRNGLNALSGDGQVECDTMRNQRGSFACGLRLRTPPPMAREPGAWRASIL